MNVLTIEEIKKRQNELYGELINLKKMQELHEKCNIFDFTEKLKIMILKIINSNEKYNYVFNRFSITESAKTSVSYREDLGLKCKEFTFYDSTVTAPVYVPEKKFNFNAIVEENTVKLFGLLKISSIEEYRNKIGTYFGDQKNAIIYKTITPDLFIEGFPYITNYLNSLAAWRYKNNSLIIPDNILEELGKEFSKKTLTKIK